MKTLSIILSIVGIITLNSCSQKSDVNAMLKDAETRAEVFTAITSNQEYLTAFMDSLHNSPQAMEMMHGDKKMMGGMMKGCMGKDSAMMKDCMMHKGCMGKDSAMMKDCMMHKGCMGKDSAMMKDSTMSKKRMGKKGMH